MTMTTYCTSHCSGGEFVLLTRFAQGNHRANFSFVSNPIETRLPARIRLRACKSPRNARALRGLCRHRIQVNRPPLELSDAAATAAFTGQERGGLLPSRSSEAHLRVPILPFLFASGSFGVCFVVDAIAKNQFAVRIQHQEFQRQIFADRFAPGTGDVPLAAGEIDQECAGE